MAHQIHLNGHEWEWIAYFAGAFLTLAYKAAAAVYNGGKQGKTWKQTMLEWMFENSAENKVSWATTFGAVWIVGGIYIGGVEWDIVGLPQLPLHVSIAFTLGSLMEWTAPEVTKRLTNLLLLWRSKT